MEQGKEGGYLGQGRRMEQGKQKGEVEEKITQVGVKKRKTEKRKKEKRK